MISQGADIDSADLTGKTALILAVKAGHLNMIELLMRNGADPRKKTNTDLTVCDLCDGAMGELLDLYRALYGKRSRMSQKEWEEEISELFLEYSKQRKHGDYY